MDRSNLLQKSPGAILGTKAGCFKHGSDCTDVGAEGGGAVLHCRNSPTRPFVTGMILYSYFSHNPYLVSLFSFIYRQTFHLLPPHQYSYLCYYTIERGCGIKGLRFLTLFYTSRSSLEELLCIAMFWLDGSSTLPFAIVSTSCLAEPVVEHLAEALASIENQAKIAKSWVEIGNFNHQCHAASELIDLTNSVATVT